MDEDLLDLTYLDLSLNLESPDRRPHPFLVLEPKCTVPLL